MKKLRFLLNFKGTSFFYFLVFGFMVLHCAVDPYLKKIKTNANNYHVLNLDFSTKAPITELYIRDDQGKKKKLKVFIDTGSNVSLINSNLYSSNKKSKYPVKSVAQSKEISYSRVSLEVLLEDTRLQQVNFYSVPFSKDFTFDVLLGNDFLSNYSILFNIPEYLVLLENSKDVFKSFPEFITDSNRFSYIAGHIVLPVVFQKHKMDFILDTGAFYSYINPERINVRQAIYRKEFEYYDILGDKQVSKLYRVDNFCVVSYRICIDNLEFSVGNSIKDFMKEQQKEIHGIVGANWMKHYRIIVDYKSLHIYITKK